MHIPVEQVLEEFAEQVLSEDVKSFVTVFVTAKKKRWGYDRYYP